MKEFDIIRIVGKGESISFEMTGGAARKKAGWKEEDQ